MPPSLLKKMSGSKERIEGNYASSDWFSSLGTSLNIDPGLTLLPGLQTRKENKGCLDSVPRPGNFTASVGDKSAKVTYDGNHSIPSFCGSRTLSMPKSCGNAVQNCALTGRLQFRDGSTGDQTPGDQCPNFFQPFTSLSSSGGGSLECYAIGTGESRQARFSHFSHGHQPCVSHFCFDTELCVCRSDLDNQPCLLCAGLAQKKILEQRREGSTSIADAHHVQLERAQGSGLFPTLTGLHPAKGGEMSENPVSTSPSGSTSVLDLREFGTSPVDPPEHFVSCALEKTAQPPKTSDIHLQIVDTSGSKEVKLQNSDFRKSSSMSKPPVETPRSKDSRITVHSQYRLVITATKGSLRNKSELSRTTSNATTSLPRAVLKPVTKANVYWTSHFPKTSIRLRVKRDRAPATFPAAAASLPRFGEHQHRPVAGGASSTSSSRHQQKPTASGQNQSQASSNDILLSTRVTGSRSIDRSTHHLRNTTIAKHQQHSPRNRSSSLPNLSSRRHMSAMGLVQGYELSALPTPPNEKQPLPFQRPNSLSSPTAAPSMWDHADNGAFDGLSSLTTSSKPIRNGAHHAGHYPNNSTQQNTYFPPNTMAYHSEFPRHQHSPPDAGSGRASHQALFSNGSMPPALRQFNGHVMQAKAYYSHAETQDLLNGWQQLWEARSRRSEAAHQFQLSQEKNQSQNLLHGNARLESESKQLRLDLGKLQQEREFLRGRIQFYEQGEMFQRYQSMYNFVASQHHEVAFLRQENERLNTAHNKLIHDMEKLAAQPRTNAAVAKNILQTNSAAAPSTPFPGYDQGDSTNSGSNPVGVPPSRTFQGSSSQEINAGMTLPHQNHVHPRCLPSQPEARVTTFPARNVDPQALSGTVNHTKNLLPISPLESSLIARQSGSAPQAHSDFTGHGEIIGDSPPQQVMIDLTDDVLVSSSSESVAAMVPQTRLPFVHENTETERMTEIIQAQTAIHIAFNKKKLDWMDGLHPGRAIHTTGVTFGLPSSKKALAAKAREDSNKAAKLSSKKTIDAMDAVAKHDDARTEQPSNDQVLKKRANNAASRKNHLQKKRRDQGKLSKEGSVASISASQAQKQARKSAKVQKRQQAASQPLAEVCRPGIQYTLDRRPLEVRIEDPQSISTRAREQQPGDETNPLIDEDDNDMEVMHFSDYVANEDQDEEMTPAQFREMLATEAGIGPDSEEEATMLQATLTAGAEDGDDSDDGGAAAFEAELEAEAKRLKAAETGFENSSAAATNANTDGPGNDSQESQESEESEEE